MDVEIREMMPSEFDELMRLLSFAFGQHPDSKEIEAARPIFQPERTLVAVAGGAIVGGAAASSGRVSVPGSVLPAAAVTSVGVLPTHRRRGVMSALMRRQLDDVRARGEPLALLYTSEGPIYGRFGYGLGTLMSVLKVERPFTAFATAHEPREIALVSRADALRSFPGVYEQVLPRRPGMLERTPAWWEHRFLEIQHDEFGYGDPFFVVCEGPDGAEGYAIYHTKSDWSEGTANGTLEVVELIAETTDSYAALWRYCFEVDLMARFVAWLRPADEPLVHMLADPRRLSFSLRDAMWVRVVDVATALSGRRYAREGRLVLEVRDGFCAWNEERYELEAAPGEAWCRPTRRSPGLTLSAADLGAAYLGGVPFETLRRAGRVVENEPGAARAADDMFGWGVAPWCPELF